MPKTTVQLHVWLRGFSLFEEETEGFRSFPEAGFKELLKSLGFSIFETREPADGREIHTHPFEHREENIQKINEFVEYVEDNNIDCDVEASPAPMSLDEEGQDLPAEEFMKVTVDARTQRDEL